MPTADLTAAASSASSCQHLTVDHPSRSPARSAPRSRNRNFSLIVVGHADRQDRADLSCDERRTSEATAALDRATSAWEWIKTRVVELAAAAGVDADEWWETSLHVTWGLVFAGAGMLKIPNPTDDERSHNRRVVMLVSNFEPA